MQNARDLPIHWLEAYRAMADHEQSTSVPPQWRQQDDADLATYAYAHRPQSCTSLHDMSCRTHGVLDQCAACI